jgi:SET domain-containing protein
MIGFIIDGLEVRFINDEVGHGVFTNKKIKKNTIIENAYCLNIKIHHIMTPELKKYVYYNNDKNFFLSLGYGSIYNHSDSPNIEKQIFWENKFIQFKTIKDIEANQQLVFCYEKRYWEGRKLQKILI